MATACKKIGWAFIGLGLAVLMVNVMIMPGTAFGDGGPGYPGDPCSNYDNYCSDTSGPICHESPDGGKCWCKYREQVWICR